MTEQTTEIQTLLTEIKTGWSGVSVLPAEVKTLREGTDKLAGDLKDVRRQLASRQTVLGARRAGQVSEGCARHMASAFIAHCERSDKLDALCSVSAQRDALLTFARDTLGLGITRARSRWTWRSAIGWRSLERRAGRSGWNWRRRSRRFMGSGRCRGNQDVNRGERKERRGEGNGSGWRGRIY